MAIWKGVVTPGLGDLRTITIVVHYLTGIILQVGNRNSFFFTGLPGKFHLATYPAAGRGVSPQKGGDWIRESSPKMPESRQFLLLPCGEQVHIPPWKNENHLSTYLGVGNMLVFRTGSCRECISLLIPSGKLTWQ